MIFLYQEFTGQILQNYSEKINWLDYDVNTSMKSFTVATSFDDFRNIPVSVYIFQRVRKLPLHFPHGKEPTSRYGRLKSKNIKGLSQHMILNQFCPLVINICMQKIHVKIFTSYFFQFSMWQYSKRLPQQNSVRNFVPATLVACLNHCRTLDIFSLALCRSRSSFLCTTFKLPMHFIFMPFSEQFLAQSCNLYPPRANRLRFTRITNACVCVYVCVHVLFSSRFL